MNQGSGKKKGRKNMKDNRKGGRRRTEARRKGTWVRRMLKWQVRRKLKAEIDVRKESI